MQNCKLWKGVCGKAWGAQGQVGRKMKKTVKRRAFPSRLNNLVGVGRGLELEWENRKILQLYFHYPLTETYHFLQFINVANKYGSITVLTEILKYCTLTTILKLL